jgi:predicted dehydrogenase
VNPDRYLPSRQLIRKQLSGPLGEVGLLRSHRWEPASVNQPALPEGLLRDIDTALWLVGKRTNRVFALEQRSANGRCVQVHLGFPGGGMALLDFDNRLPRGDGYQSLSVIALSGAAYADDHQNTQLVFRGGHPEAVQTEERAGQLAAIAQEFVDALRTGRDLMTENAASWRAVFAVAAAVEQSLATGRSVAMGER